MIARNNTPLEALAAIESELAAIVAALPEKRR